MSGKKKKIFKVFFSHHFQWIILKHIQRIHLMMIIIVVVFVQYVQPEYSLWLRSLLLLLFFGLWLPSTTKLLVISGVLNPFSCLLSIMNGHLIDDGKKRRRKEKLRHDLFEHKFIHNDQWLMIWIVVPKSKKKKSL